jgi:hypothetical protein
MIVLIILNIRILLIDLKGWGISFSGLPKGNFIRFFICFSRRVIFWIYNFLYIKIPLRIIISLNCNHNWTNNLFNTLACFSLFYMEIICKILRVESLIKVRIKSIIFQNLGDRAITVADYVHASETRTILNIFGQTLERFPILGLLIFGKDIAWVLGIFH